jgi:hypothetical protein
LDDVRTGDDDVLVWLVSALCLQVLDLSDDALAIDDLAKDDVLLVKMWCGNSGNKELGAVCAFSGGKPRPS